MKTLYVSLAALTALLAGCGGSSGDRAPVDQNQAPTISAIADQATSANQESAPIAFSVMDENVTGLTISVTSDRQNVVPDSALALSGAAASRSLTATPVIDTTGDAMITIIATDDGGLSASTSFLLTVNAEQRSMAQFARDTFVTAEDDEPELVNAVEFLQDAEDDDFADLLAQP